MTGSFEVSVRAHDGSPGVWCWWMAEAGLVRRWLMTALPRMPPVAERLQRLRGLVEVEDPSDDGAQHAVVDQGA